jgi:hypothetical protein
MALGKSTTTERRLILKHVRSCESCRAFLREMHEVADQVLFAAPSADPPPGFEQRVLNALGPHKSPRVIQLRWVAFAAVFALTLGALWARLLPRIFESEQDRLAAQYIQALETLGGKALYASRLESITGEDVGSLFVYEGNPSWMFLTIEDAEKPTGELRVRVSLARGDPLLFDGLELLDGRGSLGLRLDVAVKQIREIEIIEETGQVAYMIKPDR